ncbi:extracellular solute-binding protein [Bacillus sp. SD088]|uniref:extracellular solute-binding protein n=1 Tax=Bacillus sp. SD088 TaxID=2782012 RepID=UPI001A95C32A|nr:extracellular solute-binding protein [Bacillus sp. SD088]MBO0991870.1 extracellular solute-binding protein [Bacillus sp. SD088]
MKKVYFLLFVFVLLLAACSKKEKTNEITTDENFNETGMPIVDEPITLEFMARKSDADNYDEVLIWKEYEKMTGIHIDWNLVPSSGWTEKRNLALSSGDYKDVFYTAALSSSDLSEYGSQGMFLKLNDLIEQYMPNLTEVLKEYPEIEKGLYDADGNIYSLPGLYEPDFWSVISGHKLWVREDWLEKLGMDVPETTDEFYDYLKAVKETDLIGNGKNEEIPFGSYSLDGLKGWMRGSFGLANRGSSHTFVDFDPESDGLRFIPTTDRYKEMLEYLHKLYDEGLIQENIFSSANDNNSSYANGTNGLHGSTVFVNTEAIYGEEEGSKFIGIAPLEGPHGDRMVSTQRSPIAAKGAFVITDKNEHVPETLRWLDYFYSDEGAKFFFMGIEGETYEENEDGKLEFVDKIKNSPDGLTMEQELSKYVTYLGGGYPGIMKEQFFDGAESIPSSLAAAEEMKPYMLEEVWPEFSYTSEEYKKRSTLAADIEKYVKEMEDKFISGSESFENWDKYVNTIEKMNLEEYMEIENTAYERYKES